MELGEFVRRARASRQSKKRRYEAAFERARRDLRLLDAVPALSPMPTIGFAQRRKTDRPVISLARQDEVPAVRKEA
jgi:hypothetical protein